MPTRTPETDILRILIGLGLALGFWSALTPPSGATGIGTTVRYQIDVDAHPDSLGEVMQSTTTPGQFLSIVHPLGKGDASGSADFGLLRARARLDPDFPTDQLSTASAETYFEDVLTISGSNLGDTATAVVSLRTIGSIRQPFYVSEVTGIASASADLLASSSVEGASDTRSFGPAGPEPIFVNYDASLTAIIRFVVGDPVTIQAALRAGSEANLNVPPEYDDFTADFLSAATLQPILLIGVTNPTVSSESGHIYPLGTTTAAPERPPLPALAISAPGPNPFRGSTTATLTLPAAASVRASVIDVTGRQVRNLFSRSLPAGAQELSWDGRDDSGRPAGAGVYFLVVESGAGRLTRKVTLRR